MENPLKGFEPLSWTKELIITFAIAAFFYYGVLTTLLGTSSPFVTVTSCSMKGHFNIGDLAVIQGTRVENINAPVLDIAPGDKVSLEMDGLQVVGISYQNKTINFTKTGDIIVYNTPLRPGEPIIHRVVVKLRSGGSYSLLTKGDANPTIDQDCRSPDVCVSMPVTQDMIVGKVLFHIPLIGHPKLLLTLSYQYGFWC